MELATVKPNEATLEIVHPGNGEKLGITVTLRSLDDEAMKSTKRKIQDAAIALQKKGKLFSSEEIDNNQNTLLFNAMTGWVWGKDENGEEVTFNGAKPAFTQTNVLRVFNELPWFRDQISEKVGETKSFF